MESEEWYYIRVLAQRFWGVGVDEWVFPTKNA